MDRSPPFRLPAPRHPASGAESGTARLRWIALAGAAAFTLAGCGGGDAPLGPPATLSRMSAEAAGPHCASGGVRIDAGVDANRDGKLVDAEVDGTQYVCSGEEGGVFLKASPATADPTCPAGGLTLATGPDTDGNGTLDADEVAATQLVCLGVDALKVLIEVSAEAEGEHCAHGGNRIQAGLDADESGDLGASEITSTAYACHPEPPAGVRWTLVSGPAVQAEANVGYMADSTGEITITLPASDSLSIGDLVAVTGLGTGSWTIAQQDGQAIYGGSLGHVGVSWSPVDTNRSWQSITSSSDGRKLAAVEYGGRIYTSTDAGITWTARETNRLWYTIASSADGQRLVAGVPGGQLHTSDDGGVTWTARESARSWYKVAASDDGLTMLAAAGGEELYTSYDGGVTWTPRGPSLLWFAASVSADGTRMAAAEYGGQVYTSVDAGVTWTPREQNRAWADLTTSADGTKIAAVVFGGQIHTSADGGVTWFAQASTGNWIGVTASADGWRQAAIQAGGQIFHSTDGGATWIPRFTDHNWSSITCSADGDQLLAVEHGGQIYRSTPYSTSGTTGGLRGAQHDAIELQYRGNGLFAPLSHEGDLTLF